MNEYITALIGLAGVIVGAVLTYVIQSRLLTKQRVWSLDDQKREWKRDQLSALADQFKKATARFMAVHYKTSDSSILAPSLDEMREVYKQFVADQITFMTESEPIADRKLDELKTEWFATLETLTNPDTPQQQHGDLVTKAGKLNFEIQNYILKLVEGTFD